MNQVCLQPGQSTEDFTKNRVTIHSAALAASTLSAETADVLISVQVALVSFMFLLPALWCSRWSEAQNGHFFFFTDQFSRN